MSVHGNEETLFIKNLSTKSTTRIRLMPKVESVS